MSRFSVEIFLSHSAENFRRGIFHCCIIFGYRKSLDNKEGVSRLSVENFCLTVPKNYVGESFTNALISGSEIFWISTFSAEYFLPHIAEIFCTGILYCCSNVGYRKCLDKTAGSIRFFHRKFFVSRCQKFT